MKYTLRSPSDRYEVRNAARALLQEHAPTLCSVSAGATIFEDDDGFWVSCFICVPKHIPGTEPPTTVEL